MSVISLDALKLSLNIPSSITTEDARLQQFLDGVEETVWRFVNRYRVGLNHPFKSLQNTEFYDGNGRETLTLKRRPVTAIASVYVDQGGQYGTNPDAFGAETLWDSTTYAPISLDESESNPSQLISFRGLLPFVFQGNSASQQFQQWPRGYGNIKITYTAGYQNLPPDIVNAVCQLVASVRSAAQRGFAIGGETLGSYVWTSLNRKDSGLAAVDDLSSAISTLALYREITI